MEISWGHMMFGLISVSIARLTRGWLADREFARSNATRLWSGA